MKIGFGAPVAGAWATPVTSPPSPTRPRRPGTRRCGRSSGCWSPRAPAWSPVYRSVLDPMVALGFAAARTSRIRLGVAILNLPFVSPAYLAKQAATVDVLSGGRLDLGLGIGWMPEEFAVTGGVHGPARRPDRGVPRPCCGRCGPTRSARFSGEFYTVPAGRHDPRPVQQPGPAGAARRHVPAGPGAGRADRGGLDHLQPRRPDQDQRGGPRDRGGGRRRGPRPGRGAHHLPGRGPGRAAEAKGPDGGRRLLSGSYEQIREDTAWLAGQGVTELFYDLNWDPQVGNPAVAPQAAADRARSSPNSRRAERTSSRLSSSLITDCWRPRGVLRGPGRGDLLDRAVPADREHAETSSVRVSVLRAGRAAR